MNKKVILISSSGGHLLQLLTLSRALGAYQLILITEKNKSTSDTKFSGFDEVCFLPHGGRERIFKFLFKFLINFLMSFFRLLRLRPRVIVTTGAHTAIPTCYIGKILGAKIIYIETCAKISSPTLTGRIIHPIADSFYVQWESMMKFYPKSQFVGRIY